MAKSYACWKVMPFPGTANRSCFVQMGPYWSEVIGP